MGSVALALILRWLHILAAITAVGGLVFMRSALVPAATETLTDDQHRALREAVRRRWSKIVAACILFLLVSGLVNFFLLLQAVKSSWGAYELPRYYHPIFGVKFILAFVVFFISSALAGRSAAFERMRANSKFWMTVNLSLAVVVVMLSGLLRMTHVGPNPVPPTEEPKQVAAVMEFGRG